MSRATAITIRVWEEAEELDPPGRGHRVDWHAYCADLGINAFGPTRAAALERLADFIERLEEPPE